MSLPLHLQSIKSSGVYRFVYDKSVVPEQYVSTLRLLVGYSEKGPFNTPVYISSRDQFIKTYGNISKRLEKKGIFFHRLALQALAYSPILCLNLKPFDKERVGYMSFNASGIYTADVVVPNPDATPATGLKVTDLYDTNRFWALDSDDLPGKIASNTYISIAATDTKEASCSLIMRPAKPEEYDLSIREWFAGVSDEMPDYLVGIQDDKLKDYFMDVYVFRGKFDATLCGPDGVLGRYFNVSGDPGSEVITLEENYVDAFGNPADALEALAADPASNFVVAYRGTTIPYFKGTNGNYLSIDLLFNSGFADHKMLMKLDETKLTGNATAIRGYLQLPADVTATDTTAAAGKDTIKYYKLTESSGTYSYAEVTGDDITTTIKKNAVEKSSASGAAASSPKYIKVTTLPATSPSISPKYIEGFTYSTNTSWSAPIDYVKGSIEVITGEYGKGIQEALTNRVDSEYHYIVDTYDTPVVVEGSSASAFAGATAKTILASIAKKKDNALAILNFPKMKDFVGTSNLQTSKTLDFKKVCTKACFPLPDDADGASWCGYFTQLVLSDGTVKSTIPAAGLISNLFEDKWNNRQPYYIVAGSQYGRIIDPDLVGPDYSFSRADRDILEPYGINVLVYEPRRGTYINSEQTAKQVPVSGLSKIHIRELVIFLQDEIADLLESYRWELNTQVLRQTIKGKADVILETCKNNGGVYDYQNICDDSNNTSETIDNELLILDTHIEPSRGAGKMVEQLYIYRTGEMRSQLVQG